MAIEITRSSGDIFRDLGFEVHEAHDLRLRSELMLDLRERIVALHESQVRVAKRLGVTQPRVSDLLKGKIHLFSLDTLVTLLSRLGATVEMRVRVPRRDTELGVTIDGVCAAVPVSLRESDYQMSATSATISAPAHAIQGTVGAVYSLLMSDLNLTAALSGNNFGTLQRTGDTHVAANTQLALAA